MTPIIAEKKLNSLIKKFYSLYMQGMRTDGRTREGPDFRFWSEPQKDAKRRSININKVKLADLNNRCLELAKQIDDLNNDYPEFNKEGFIVTPDDYNKIYSRHIKHTLEYSYKDFVKRGYVFVVWPVSY